MQSQNNTEIKKWLRKIWIGWAALLYTLFVYVRLCSMKESDIPYFAAAKLPLDTIKYICFGIGIVSLYFAYQYRRRWLRNGNVKLSSRVVERADRIKKPPIFLKYASDVLFTGGISVVSGFLGLLYLFISKDWRTLYISIVISAIALIYFKPNVREFEQYLSKNGKGNE